MMATAPKHEPWKGPIDEMFEGIDGPLLARQRETLAIIIDAAEKAKETRALLGKDTFRITLTPQSLEDLLGLQSMLDSVADIAHDTYGKRCLIGSTEEDED